MSRGTVPCRHVIRVLALGLVFAAAAATGAPAVEAVLDVAPVWAGHPVGFCLLTHPPRQFVAYYDAERWMTVASRDLGEETWHFTRLDARIGWDSHNYITMHLDDERLLHVSGNMHVSRLNYWRSETPFDAATLVRVPAMVGSEEERTTYPKFLRGPERQLLFTYRDGSSGSGNQIYNVYEPDGRRWRRLLDKPLADGEGQRNAYFMGPQKGPDGWYHLCWVWRATPDCATNHHLCYARSRDLVRWEGSDGRALALPITYASAEVADPVPEGGGIINGNTKIGFGHEQRVILSYHKYDENGVTQAYNARREADGWRIYQASDWNYRWAFAGGGTINFEVRVGAVRTGPGGTLVQSWYHVKHGQENWRVDPESLRAVEKLPATPSKTPAGLTKLEGDFSGLGLQMRNDTGTSGEAGLRYLLRWETLGKNRDRPRKKPWPAPSMLRLYRIRE